MKKRGPFIILGILFVFFQKAGRDLARNGNIVWNMVYWLQILLISLATGTLLGCAISFALYHISQWVNTKKMNRKSTVIFISTLGMILFRNNGKYAMLVFLCICILGLWCDKEHRKLQGRFETYCSAKVSLSGDDYIAVCGSICPEAAK